MNSRATSLAPDTQEWSRGEQVPAPQAAQNKSMEFARNAPSADFMLNQQTKVFISSLYDAFNTGNVPELKRLYCFAWDQQTNAYYKDCPWPSEEAIAELCDGSQLFQLLYKEHCFRHLYAIKRSNGKPYAGVLERVAAFEHYCRLFDFIIDYGNDFPYTLPLEWLFDLISEFVYQFQSYWQYHAKIEKMSEEDIANFQEHAEAWHPSMVIYYLDELQKRSMIKEEMIAKKTGAPAPPVPGQVLHMLGYLAMIGEARLQLVLGDYNACLDAISTIDISSDAKGTGLFTRVPLCRVYLYYCAGFSYMMLKRFPEASRVLNLISVSLERSHTNHGNGTLAKTIGKKREQMYGLLCLIQQVAPGMSLSGIVQKRIDQKFGDKIQRVRRGDDTAFDELFEFSAPNFITATPPDYTKYINHNQFAKRQQSLPFLNEIKARRDINKISSSIKFYTTVTIAKLATLLDTTESALRERLMFIKYKTMYDMSGESGSVELKGETKMESFNDTHFYIKDDTVIVSTPASAAQREHAGNDASGEYFVRNITRFEDIIQNIQKDWEGMPPSMSGNHRRRRGGGRGGGRGGRGGRRNGRGGGRSNNNGGRRYNRGKKN